MVVEEAGAIGRTVSATIAVPGESPPLFNPFRVGAIGVVRLPGVREARHPGFDMQPLRGTGDQFWQLISVGIAAGSVLNDPSIDD